MYLNPTGVSYSGTPCAFGQSIDQVGRRDRLANTVLPAAALDQIVEQQGDDIVRLKKGPIRVENAKAVRIAVRRNPDLRPGFTHLPAELFEQVIVRFRRMSSKENVAVVVDRRHCYPGFAQHCV